MKNKNKLWTLFESETRFEDPTDRPVPFRGTGETELDHLKDRLLQKMLDANLETEVSVALRRAATEAAAIAWMTPFPLLVFPALLDEKANLARRRSVRQRRIQKRSRKLLTHAL